jgi:lipoprotein-anchoring transpeptidase ErfK/SrfK
MDHYPKKENRKSDWALLALSILMLLVSAGFFVYTKYPAYFESAVRIEKKEGLSPDEKIVINFSRPIITRYLNFQLKVYPDSQVDYYFENNNKKLTIIPKSNWLIGNEYGIEITGKNVFLSGVKSKIYFKTIEYPQMAGFYPEYGAKDVVLDIEDPIKAVFDRPVGNFKIKFALSPLKEFGYEFNETGDQISLMPKEELEKVKKYNVEVYIKYKDEPDGAYKKISDTFFETKPPPPQNWDKDFNVRLEQARKFTECKIKEGKYIDINLASQVMTIFENGKILDSFMISSGKRGMDTPQGSFQIRNKFPRAWSKKYGLFMPYWMAIVPSGQFGIHELPEWPGGYKEGQNHLGTPVSHGCVRLGVGPAEMVYNFAEIGTPVIVHS